MVPSIHSEGIKSHAIVFAAANAGESHATAAHNHRESNQLQAVAEAAAISNVSHYTHIIFTPTTFIITIY